MGSAAVQQGEQNVVSPSPGKAFWYRAFSRDCGNEILTPLAGDAAAPTSVLLDDKAALPAL